MHTSVASLAVISRFESGRPFYLARWSNTWNAFSMLGGHKRDGETHRACLVRELAEPDELHLPPPPDDPDATAAAPVENVDPAHIFVRVAAEPLGRLVYEAFSRSTGEPTNYIIELFAAELSDEARRHFDNHPDLRWLSEQEIDAGRTADGRAVSDTIRHHLGWLSRHHVPVSWGLTALTRTREVMAANLAGSVNDAGLTQECAFVARQLRLMFPAARALVVRQRFEGFRPRVRPHKLLVEIARSADVSAPGVFACREVHVVKVGQPQEAERANDLEEELRGWERCRPDGTDTILSSLHGVRDESNHLVGLVYSDATSALGGRSSHLEEAVRECCRFGLPTLHSIIRCLHQLFDRLNVRFYSQSFEAAPDTHLGEAELPGHPVRRNCETKEAAPTRLRARVDRGLARISEDRAEPEGEERRRLRREALALLAVRDERDFLDPFDYLRMTLEKRHPVPYMLVGASHGDLHGRNVQVGRMVDAVGSPVVFDYGDIHPANHLGWDFVKLETELKVRIYPHLFPKDRQQYLRKVHDFELRLARRTASQHHNSPQLAPPSESDPRLERLARVLLEIRMLARRYLETERPRIFRWLEEYYFLLACYGCNTTPFATYDDQEWLAVYCSAGTAARQLSLPWKNLIPDIEQARQQARQLLSDLPAETCDGLVRAAQAKPCFLNPRLNHHVRLEFTRVWVEAELSPSAHFVQAGLALLEELQKEFPHVLEITEVRILALLELHREAEGMALIQEVRRRHVEPAFEIDCRLGRVFKDRGERLWLAGSPAAREEFRRALAVYRRAWESSEHYYPGINVAALLLLLADSAASQEESRAVARRVLDRLREQAATDLWPTITRADAHLLLDEPEEAERLYRQIRQSCTAQNVRSVTRQLRLLLPVLGRRAREFWTGQRLSEVFGFGLHPETDIQTPTIPANGMPSPNRPARP